MKIRQALALTLSVMLATAPAFAHKYDLGSLTINHPWARPTPPGLKVTAVYFDIRNNASTPDRLVGWTSSSAMRAELHETRIEGGMAKMRPVSALVLPANGRVKAEPGGLHLMLMELKQPLKVGDRIPVTLKFERAGSVNVEAVVEDGKKSAKDEHRHH
jgi:copper(I)-binding protein